MKCFKPYDVFISHAVEDKAEVTDELYRTLENNGIRVWYSGDALTVGESIIKRVNSGLKKSRCGVVILSRDYISGVWTNFELMALLTQHNIDKKIILPIRHKLTFEEVCERYPQLADKYILSTEKGIHIVAKQIENTIKEQNRLCYIISLLSWFVYVKRNAIITILLTGMVTLCIILSFLYIRSLSPSSFDFDIGIKARKKAIPQPSLSSNTICDIPLSKLTVLFDSFDNRSIISTRHYFEFSTGSVQVKAKAKLRLLGIPIDQASIEEKYGLKNYTSCLLESSNSTLSYLFINKDSLAYERSHETILSGNEYHVTLTYHHFIRSILVTYHYNNSTLTEKILYLGVHPKEELIYQKSESGSWDYIGYITP